GGVALFLQRHGSVTTGMMALKDRNIHLDWSIDFSCPYVSVTELFLNDSQILASSRRIEAKV
ncbi:hypothetical protein, partial [Desulfosporosinus fructosivorans]|uniref:hypothetical protein n=1 Tax=Desulfosporosinus fructosivorans TaxID=2018669 RepID=UPI001A7EB536